MEGWVVEEEMGGGGEKIGGGDGGMGSRGGDGRFLFDLILYVH